MEIDNDIRWIWSMFRPVYNLDQQKWLKFKLLDQLIQIWDQPIQADACVAFA